MKNLFSAKLMSKKISGEALGQVKGGWDCMNGNGVPIDDACSTAAQCVRWAHIHGGTCTAIYQ